MGFFKAWKIEEIEAWSLQLEVWSLGVLEDWGEKNGNVGRLRTVVVFEWLKQTTVSYSSSDIFVVTIEPCSLQLGTAVNLESF